MRVEWNNWSVEGKKKKKSYQPGILYSVKLLKNDPEGWDGEGGGRGVQDEEHM